MMSGWSRRVASIAAVLLWACGSLCASAETAMPRVRVARPAEGGAVLALDAALASYEWIQLVPASAPASLTIDVETEGLRIRGADGVAAAPAIAVAAPDAGRRLAEAVVRAAHRHAISSLHNPASRLDVGFSLERADGGPEDGPLVRVEPGAELRWEARNASGKSLYVTVFAVSADRGVTLVYPFHSRPKPLRSGDAVDQKGSVDIPEGARTATDRLQLVATPARIDPERFTDPERLGDALAELAQGDWFGAHHEISVRREVAEIVEESPIARIVPEQRAQSGAAAVAAPGTRAASPLAEASPPAPRRRVGRGAPRVLRFGVHFARPTELGAVKSRLAKLRTLCGRGGMACTVKRFFGEGDVFEIERRGRRLREGASQTVASAFEQAYAIRSGIDAARAEPFLELEMLYGTEGAASSASAPSDDWHLRHVRAADAWATLRQSGRAKGREAEGILVAHVDTGYRPHPEVWDGAGAAPPLRVSAGRDFVADDEDALDPMTGRRPEAHPAHGTASASVLASPSGCQLDGQAGCAAGIARGAELAPLRAHRSVSHFHSGRLARVLHDAATGALVEPVDLVSVTMAGPPGWALWQASALAERRGLVVVASAGSAGGPVLWPARFPSTIGVATTGPGCQGWSASGRGLGVDVSAPGHDIWRASTAEGGHYMNAPGSSGGFAAAVVSGGAALWLARHAAEDRLAALRAGGGLTAALRASLSATAWKPARSPKGVVCQRGGWDASFGPGILDAAALVKRRPAAGAGPPPAVALLDLPLFRSIHPAGAAARAGESYRQLFDLAPEARIEAVAYFEAEVLHHYAMTEEVARALDLAVGKGASPEAFVAARRALLRQGLSKPLREALRPPES